MPTGVSIIDFEPAHRPAFEALNHELDYEWITRYFYIEGPDRQPVENPQQYILERGGHILMAVCEGEIVGTCALVKEHDGVFELARLAVAPAAQRRGIGWALGQGMLGKARQLGARRVEVLSISTLLPALKLYDKLGFRPAALIPGHPGDVRMVLDL
ncbi:GNAT family N-acetyltransferase [Hymenobacter armeniacus]|uniref:GNAT family N-acetyltransferase n=1 Tax=Hymenobacter armeniacus TaxID=2771358 RepID=A0ABR8JVP4_9BACT|nr:GNAT family N-acetyltransferase [Hymenobacter armeniacus]MBD2723387.1 GNAT family N-acetyltransferase [Hymenobacter armeniacus]